MRKSNSHVQKNIKFTGVVFDLLYGLNLDIEKLEALEAPLFGFFFMDSYLLWVLIIT